MAKYLAIEHAHEYTGRADCSQIPWPASVSPVHAWNSRVLSQRSRIGFPARANCAAGDHLQTQSRTYRHC